MCHLGLHATWLGHKGTSWRKERENDRDSNTCLALSTVAVSYRCGTAGRLTKHCAQALPLWIGAFGGSDPLRPSFGGGSPSALSLTPVLACPLGRKCGGTAG